MPGHVRIDVRGSPLPVDPSWDSSMGPGPGAYRTYPGRDGILVTRLNRDDWGLHAAEEALHDDEGPHHHVDPLAPEALEVPGASPEAPSELLPHVSETAETLVSAVLVADPPLVEATLVRSRSLRQRLADARLGQRLAEARVGQRLADARRRLVALTKKAGERRPSAEPGVAGPRPDPDDASPPSPSPSPGPSTELPGAYRVEPDLDDPAAAAEIVRAAPVHPGRAARLRRLLRRLVRLRFELGENRAALEAEVRVIQRRIDGTNGAAELLEEDESPPVAELDDSPSDPEAAALVAGSDAGMALDEAYARQYLSVPAKNPGKPDPPNPDADANAGRRSADRASPRSVQDASPWTTPEEDSSEAIDEAYARQYLAVPTTKDGKPDRPDADAGRHPKRTWGRPTRRSLLDDDDDDNSNNNNNNNNDKGTFDLTSSTNSVRAGQDESSNGAPSQSSLADALRAALDENEHLRDEQVRLRQDHQEQLRTVEAEHQRSLAERDSDLEETKRGLEATQPRMAEREDELEFVKRELEATQQRLAEKEDETQAMKFELAKKVHELQVLGDELAATNSDKQLLEEQSLAHEERVRELEATIAVHQLCRSDDLEAAQADVLRLCEDLEASQEVNSDLRDAWDETEAGYERRIVAMTDHIDELADENRRLHAELDRRLQADVEDAGRKRRRVLRPCNSQQLNASNVLGCCSYSQKAARGLETMCSGKFEFVCTETPIAACCDNIPDHDTSSLMPSMPESPPVATSLAGKHQLWSLSGVQVVAEDCHTLRNQKILADVRLGQEVSPEFPYPCSPDQLMWAEVVDLYSAWSFPLGAPTDLMERVAVGVVRKLRQVSCDLMLLRQVVCYRSSILISTETVVRDPVYDKPVLLPVEIRVALVDRESSLCVDSQSMTSESRKLVVWAKGFLVDNGLAIRRGGLDQILSSIKATLGEELQRSREAACPTCFRAMHPNQVATEKYECVKASSSASLYCRHGHRFSAKLICGPRFTCTPVSCTKWLRMPRDSIAEKCRRSVVVIAVHNAVTRRREEVGSGYFADRRLGLIVTAAHTIMRESRFLWMRTGRQFHIGVPREDGDGVDFRYRAEIAATGSSSVDACVLRITGIIANTLHGGRSPPAPQALQLAINSSMGEDVRLVGYNQGGEGKYSPGTYLDLQQDVLRGYVCKQFKHRASGCAQEEIVVEGGQAIPGHSGGPCVNARGEVLGVLSRIDRYYGRRWYLVPFAELAPLLEAAREECSRLRVAVLTNAEPPASQPECGPSVSDAAPPHETM